MAALQIRDISSFGGYALLGTTCPSGTTVCSGSCCPDGYQCHGDTGAYQPTYCCPSAEDCGPTLNVMGACADSSWGLFSYVGTPYCCPPGSVGAYMNKLCLGTDLPIPSSVAIRSLTQATASGSVSPSSRPMSTGGSNGSGGAATTSDGSTNGSSNSESGAPGSSNSNGGGNASGGNSGSSSGLSQGAIIAIAVLATIIGMLSLFIAWTFYKRHKRRRVLPPPIPVVRHPIPPMEYSRAPLRPSYRVPVETELHGVSVLKPGTDGTTRVELDGQTR